MRFDDRLRTVLAQPAASRHDRAVRWRQLVELVARAPPDSDGELVSEAIQQIRATSASVEERVRVAAALAIAAIPMPSELVATFAADRLGVAAPVLASARLTASEWKSVATGASAECRDFIAAMRSEESREPLATAAKEGGGSAPIPSISDVVARIERLRQAREASESPSGEEPGARQPSAFRWECNEAGEIDWVEGAPRGALVGATIARRSAGHGVDSNVERAFASRAPFHDGVLELPGDAAIGGLWNISGIPAFERSNGRFAGYRGIAERRSGSQSSAAGGLASDPDSLRELAHEIKTPLNAIIGFAEIITGEYLGPAEGRFRERASDIVAQARLLLSAIEDLDFAARIHSPESAANAQTDIGELVERLAGAIREIAATRDVQIDGSRTTTDLTAAVQAEVAERLVLRMCSAVIARASPGEHLRLSVDQGRDHCTVSITRPRALFDLRDDDLFGTASDAMSPEFPLRLARGLAQTAGADIITCERGITLLFHRA